MTCLAKIVAGGMPGGVVAGSKQLMRAFDYTGDSQHDRHARVVHFGTFNASPPSAAAGITALRRIATGEPIHQANHFAGLLRTAWDAVLERLEVAGYVYGSSSIFHVYFETNRDRVAKAASRNDLLTCDPKRLKGMPPQLVTQYQRHLRYRGVDIMSSTGGLLSSAHTEQDVQESTVAFEGTIRALCDDGLLLRLGTT